MTKLSRKLEQEYKKNGVNCSLFNDTIGELGEYFSIFNSLLSGNQTYWFRGHSSLKYDLIPSALRFKEKEDRNTALQLVTQFKRLAEIKLATPPKANEELKWLQLAQHYGLPTRLLDWTENAAVALYFTCLDPNSNGAVIFFNPIDLNLPVDSRKPRIFDSHNDASIIEPYLSLDGSFSGRSKHRTIAIHPVLNSERIVLQQGVFTLHGKRTADISKNEAPSMVKIPILKQHKSGLLKELDRVGIGENTIFPELEHLCNYLKTKQNLN